MPLFCKIKAEWYTTTLFLKSMGEMGLMGMMGWMGNG